MINAWMIFPALLFNPRLAVRVARSQLFALADISGVGLVFVIVQEFRKISPVKICVGILLLALEGYSVPPKVW